MQASSSEDATAARRPQARSSGRRPSCGPAAALGLEWLETDGLGGFACGTVAGARTRRYHGWYVPAIPPPRRRWMLVVGLRRVRDGATASDDRHLDAGLPRRRASRTATPHLVAFPRSSPSRPGRTRRTIRVERSLCLVRDRSRDDRALGQPRVDGDRAAGAAAAARSAASHRLQQRDGRAGTRRSRSAARCRWVRPVPYLPRLYPARGRLAADAPDPVWYRRLLATPRSRERGYDAEEDLWSPLEWTWTLRARRAGLRPLLARGDRGRPGPLPRRASVGAARRFARTGDPVLRRAGPARRGLPRRGESRGRRRSWPDFRGSRTGAATGHDRRAGARAGDRPVRRGRAGAQHLRRAAARRPDPQPLLGRRGRAGVRRDRRLALVHPRRRVVRPRAAQRRPGRSPLLGAVRSIIDGVPRGNALRHRRRAGRPARRRPRRAAR